MRQITSSSLSNQSLATVLLCHTYTVDADREIFFRLFADQVAGNGVYTAYITIQRLGAGSAYEVQPRTAPTVPSGITSIAFTTTPIPVKNTDVVKVYLLGLAGDTTTPDIVTEVWEADYVRPTTAGQHNADVNATGEIGIDWGNVANPTTAIDFTNTRIKNLIDSLSVSLSAGDLAAIIAGVNTEVDTILTAVASSFARVNNLLRASTLSLVQGDTWAEPLTLTPFAWAAGDELRLTVKDVNTYKQSTSDADSILQWLLTNGASASDGLVYINQAAAGANRTKGSLAVVDATTGVITLNLDEAISLLVPGTYVFDVKVFSSAGVITTIGGGTLVVDSTITFSIT